MKKHSILAGFGLAMLALSVQAQDVTSVVSPVRKPKSYEVASLYRLGRQGVSLSSVNNALAQTGYRSLPNQFTVFGITSEVNRSNSPWSLISAIDVAFNSTKQPVTNGTNTVRASYFQWGLGGGYRIIRTDKFTLMPKLMLSPTIMGLRITKNNAPAPSLTTALADPGSQQTASFGAGAITGDLGLSGQYRFAFKSSVTQTDCGPMTTQRALLLGFDMGYRLSSTASFRQSNRSDLSDNTTANLSGWYVAARLGFGRRYIR